MRVLVVGGGIGGLFLGAALSRVGIECEIVEKQPAWSTTGAAITLYPNGMRALRHLGVEDAVWERGAPLDGVDVLTRDGQFVSHSAIEPGTESERPSWCIAAPCRTSFARPPLRCRYALGRPWFR